MSSGFFCVCVSEEGGDLAQKLESFILYTEKIELIVDIVKVFYGELIVLRFPDTSGEGTLAYAFIFVDNKLCCN
jgi:hypothetical protein